MNGAYQPLAESNRALGEANARVDLAVSQMLRSANSVASEALAGRWLQAALLSQQLAVGSALAGYERVSEAASDVCASAGEPLDERRQAVQRLLALVQTESKTLKPHPLRQ